MHTVTGFGLSSTSLVLRPMEKYSKMLRLSVRSLALCLLTTLAACSAPEHVPGLYRVDVRQGNHLDSAQIERLQSGMSRQQVQAVLGSPLIVDPFHPDRWDYYYAYRPAGGQPSEERRLTLWFTGDSLARIQR